MIKALFFDLNGTLINIHTDEGDDNVYRVTANFLSYYGVYIDPGKLKELYFELNREQRHQSKEEFPEFDAACIFQEVIRCFSKKSMTALERVSLAASAACVYRSASRFCLELYPDVKFVLDTLKEKYQLAAVSDGQSLWAVPEMRAVGLEGYFRHVIVSGDYGFRKPDPRMYTLALDRLALKAHEVIFVGNDMYRDVYGADAAGMKTVFFKSNQGDHGYHGAEASYIIYNFRQLLDAVSFIETHSV